MDLGLADSVCLVTGSTGGIGLETAELLRLPPPVLVQRPVGVTLQPSGGVPVGLAVANEQKGRHVRLG